MISKGLSLFRVVSHVGMLAAGYSFPSGITMGGDARMQWERLR